MLDPDDHPAAVDIGGFEAHCLGCAQSRGVGGRQRRARLQARNRFEKPHGLIGTQHNRQLARLAGVGNTFRDLAVAGRHAEEEPKRADGLIQRRPGNPLRHEMNLKSSDIPQAEPLW